MPVAGYVRVGSSSERVTVNPRIVVEFGAEPGGAVLTPVIVGKEMVRPDMCRCVVIIGEVWGSWEGEWG